MADRIRQENYFLNTGDFLTIECDKLYFGKTRVSNAAASNMKWAAIIKDTATEADSNASVSIDSDTDPTRFDLNVGGTYPVLTVYLALSTETDTMGAGIYHYEVWLYDTTTTNRQAILEGEISIEDAIMVNLFTP